VVLANTTIPSGQVRSTKNTFTTHSLLLSYLNQISALYELRRALSDVSEQLFAGTPAKFLRNLTADETAALSRAAAPLLSLAAEHLSAINKVSSSLQGLTASHCAARRPSPPPAPPPRDSRLGESTRRARVSRSTPSIAPPNPTLPWRRWRGGGSRSARSRRRRRGTRGR
jgi:hypothetical protein